MPDGYAACEVRAKFSAKQPLRFPRLDLRVIRHDQALWRRIDQVLRLDPAIRKAAFHVLEAERHVRRTTNDLGWSAFLWAEEEANARLTTVAIIVARWAFWEGFRCRHGSAPVPGANCPSGSLLAMVICSRVG